MSPLDQLERLDEAVLRRWCPQEVLGFVAVAVGGTVASVAFGVCVTLQILKEVL